MGVFSGQVNRPVVVTIYPNFEGKKERIQQGGMEKEKERGGGFSKVQRPQN